MTHLKNLVFFHLLLNFLWMPAHIFGQNTFQVMEIPQKFVVPSNENDLKEDGLNFKGYTWVVYSDRIFNPSSTAPGSSEPMKNLEFLKSYLVIGRHKQYLHLARGSHTEKTGITQVEDFGWVEMSKLLLWNHCLIRPDNYCNKKAIVIFSKETKYLFEVVKQGDENVAGFRIFYIYKSFGDKYLIGTAPRIPKDADHAAGLIVDWVSKEFVWVWDDIEAVEPNCKFDKVFSDPKIESPSVIFKTAGLAAKYLKKGIFSSKHLLWLSDTCTERMSANWLRFPILAEEEQIYSVAVFPEYSGIAVDKGEKVIEGFGAWEQDSSNSMFNKVMLVSQEDLGKIIDIYNAFFEKINPSSSIAEIASAWKEILLDVRYDQRNSDLTLLTFTDINRMLFSFKHSNILPGNIPIQTFDLNYSSETANIQLYISHLSDNLSFLKTVLNELNYEYSFYSNGLLYYWLPTNLLP